MKSRINRKMEVMGKRIMSSIQRAMSFLRERLVATILSRGAEGVKLIEEVKVGKIRLHLSGYTDKELDIEQASSRYNRNPIGAKVFMEGKIGTHYVKMRVYCCDYPWYGFNITCDVDGIGVNHSNGLDIFKKYQTVARLTDYSFISRKALEIVCHKESERKKRILMKDQEYVKRQEKIAEEKRNEEQQQEKRRIIEKQLQEDRQRQKDIEEKKRLKEIL